MGVCESMFKCCLSCMIIWKVSGAVWCILRVKVLCVCHRWYGVPWNVLWGLGDSLCDVDAEKCSLLVYVRACSMWWIVAICVLGGCVGIYDMRYRLECVCRCVKSCIP